MKLTLVKKGIFRRRYLKLPKGFLMNHAAKSGKATPIHGLCNDDFIIVSTSERELEKRRCVIDDLLDEDAKQADYLVKLAKNGDKVPYKDAIGFFSFRGEVYFKVKGGAGKSVKCMDTNFTNSIKERFPDEFDNYTLQQIGTIMVRPLNVV